MTTLAQLADRAQTYVNDAAAGTWSQDVIEAWSIDGIRDYSIHFPRTQTSAVEVSGDSPGHEFSLPTDFLDVLKVEYPTDEDPPAFLLRWDHQHPAFFNREGYYDVEAIEEAGSQPTLYLSEEPSDGETITITYQAIHDVSLDPTDTITIPTHHEHLVCLYVVMRAAAERLLTEGADADVSVVKLDGLRRSALEAELSYRRAIKAAEVAKGPSGFTGPWTADAYDPIY